MNREKMKGFGGKRYRAASSKRLFMMLLISFVVMRGEMLWSYER